MVFIFIKDKLTAASWLIIVAGSSGGPSRLLCNFQKRPVLGVGIMLLFSWIVVAASKMEKNIIISQVQYFTPQHQGSAIIYSKCRISGWRRECDEEDTMTWDGGKTTLNQEVEWIITAHINSCK
jgi:hypothetical protein